MAVEKQDAAGIFRPMSIDRTLLAAQGYIELDMPADALAELDALGHEECELEAVLQMRLFILMKTPIKINSIKCKQTIFYKYEL